METLAGDEGLWLLPERAAYWVRRETLLVADAHLGKAAAFRQGGIPVPSGTTADNLERLSALIARLRARRLVFLGDLVHNRAAREAATPAFVRWRERHATVDIVLVRGNHERGAGDIGAEWKIETVVEPHVIGGLALCHKPQRVAHTYAVAGHVHPAARLAGRGRELARLPCFHFTSGCAILPAFGAFTGMADVEPGPSDRVFVVADTQVVQVT